MRKRFSVETTLSDRRKGLSAAPWSPEPPTVGTHLPSTPDPRPRHVGHQAAGRVLGFPARF